MAPVKADDYTMGVFVEWYVSYTQFYHQAEDR